MKFNQLTKIFVTILLLTMTACKKYGYNIPDGYPDNSGNIATGSIDTNMKVIDKSKYSQARVFPGLVDPSEPRVQDAKFTLDLNYTDQTAGNLRISVAPEPQFSTGYYAAPGELIKIVVPQGIEGLVVQIGGQTDDLSGKSPLLRDPVIYMRQQLYAGNNFVRNLYGGTIYIRASHAYAVPVEFSISGACVSPDFILGKSNDAVWMEQVKASKVPWLELRSNRVIFLVPRDKVVAAFNSPTEPYTQPGLVMSKWNDVFELDYNGWMGLSDNAVDAIDRSPQGAWRGVLDIQLSLGYGHSGFPFVGQNDNEWFGSFTSLKNLSSNGTGNWGSYHEFGHNCQQTSAWSWSTLGETTNNLFSFKVANRIGANYSGLHRAVNSNFPLAITYAGTAGLKDFDRDVAMNDPFRRMTPFVQILELYGYGAMTYLYKEARHADRLNSSDILKHNFVYEKLSDYTQTDLSPFFGAWGILISDAVVAKVSAKYPPLTKAIWTYNPLTKTGGTGSIIYTTTVSASSSQSNDGNVTNLIDGVVSTSSYWSSQTSPAPTAAQTFPIAITLATNSPAPMLIKGVTFAQRQNVSTGYVKDVEIFTSTDNVNYTSVGTTTLPQTTAVYNYNFPDGKISTKYVKVVIKNGANAVSCNLSECNLIKP
ncbi:M60 family metallopeptidase [Pedobacter gandavensis]|nr:M60 family metallopeptidase [Pedobacter gandavensis]